MLFKRFLLILLLNSFWQLSAQDFLDSIYVSVSQPQSITEYFSDLESTSKLRFFYLDEWLESFEITSEENDLSLRQALNNIFRSTDLGFSFVYQYAVIIHKDPTHEMERDEVIRSAQINKIKVEALSLGRPGSVKKDLVTLVGTVKDREHQAPLVGATISIANTDIALATDAKGDYRLSVTPGEYVIRFRYVNYQEKLINLSIYEDGRGDIFLEEEATTLQEVVVMDQSIVTERIGQSSIKMVDVKRTPALFGEIDVVRSLQTKTGVTAVSEVSTGFNVRGGGADQNLVLFDGTPVFNTSHALGFFSAFNSEAVKEASFFKGGIPAEYGGRVSSVLNMSSNEGSYTKWNGSVGIGFISGSLAVGGPIKKDTSSIVLSLRSTYSDWVLNLLQSRYNDVEESSVSFYDGTMKFATKLKSKGKLTASAYWSKDRFRLVNDTTNQWQNQVLSFRYDNNISSKLYYSAGIQLGSYSYKVTDPDPATAFELDYKVNYPSIKIDFNRDSKHKQTFGLQSTFYNFKPGTLRPVSSESNANSITIASENSLETAIYFSDAFMLGNRFNLDIGLRLSLFNRFGPGVVYHYQHGMPLEPRTTIDSAYFKGGELMKTYWGPEPRFTLRYTLDGQSSIKMGYNRILQYIHLISNSASVTPIDIWQSSNTYLKPQIADQISIGYFRNSKSNVFEGFIEAYYKTTQNILDFKDGSRLILNRKIETALLPGFGKSYGIEFSIDKVKGRLVGSLNYTYSRSFRIVNGNSNLERINNGEYYPSNYDQPHIFNLNWRYGLRKKVFFSGIFTFHSGRPVSLPFSAYSVDGYPIIDFSERNNYRLPNYHRLDLSIIVEGSNKKNRRVDGQWVISIYNAYGRRNPYSAFYAYNTSGSVKPLQISLIGVPIPSLSYRIKF